MKHSPAHLLAALTLLACLPAMAAVAVYLPAEGLARRAVVVVEATVAESASGFDPRSGGLATYVTLDVARVHRGPSDLDRIVLREPGGVMGDLVNELDAVPVYEPGERVFVFLEPGPDGALRTAGMFYGKYRLLDETRGAPRLALRDLDARGLLRRRGAPRTETVTVDKLVRALATPARPAPSTRFRGRRARRPRAPLPAAGFHRVPPEHDSLQWGPAPRPGSDATAVDRPASGTALAQDGPGGGTSRFVPLSGGSPTRWTEPDFGAPVRVNVERAGNPLGDGAAAVAEIARAAAAWTDVPQSRLTVTLDDDDDTYTSAQTQSPATNYTATNIVLFDDPYGDISDPVGCSGVLAIGGYWRSSSTGTPLHGISFHRALQLYVIFNNGFQCFLGNADNLAEVATHELGHGLGFGHSSTPDAIMRSSAYGNRGAVLGDDDIDGAHCHYPHTLQIDSPDGGEAWPAGATHSVDWTATLEDGGDPGTVDLEYTVDGLAWNPIATDAPNNGSYPWTLPATEAAAARVRVLRPNAPTSPPGYPTACSEDQSDGSFAITAPPGPAGAVAGGGVTLGKGSGGNVVLSWSASCSGQADDYSIYEGGLETLRSGGWDHVARACSTSGALQKEVSPAPGARYFLVAPVAASGEGRFGESTAGATRPASAYACTAREVDSGCGS